MDKLELPGWFKVIIFIPSYLICLAVVTLTFNKLAFDLIFSKDLPAMKKFIFTFCLLLALSLASNAQHNISITRKILSKSTKEPVPYAHLNIVGTGTGTIANSEG